MSELMTEMNSALRARHYSRRTEECRVSLSEKTAANVYLNNPR